MEDSSGAATAVGAGIGMGAMLFACIVLLVIVAAMWKVFTKAGKPGWAAIIPFYNIWILLQIVGRPGWWLVLMLIPGVSFIILIILSIDMAKSFGKGTGFGLGLAFLSLIFYPILGFGDAKYNGPSVTA